MSAGDTLPGDVRVYRVLRPVHVSAETQLPLWTAFQPSSADYEHARSHAVPVRVSAWDGRKVSPTEAARYRGVSDAQIFALEVGALERVTGVPLRVVEDPDGAPPGVPDEVRGAHVGIEGLARAEVEARPRYRARLQRVADLASPVALSD